MVVEEVVGAVVVGDVVVGADVVVGERVGTEVVVGEVVVGDAVVGDLVLVGADVVGAAGGHCPEKSAFTVNKHIFLVAHHLQKLSVSHVTFVPEEMQFRVPLKVDRFATDPLLAPMQVIAEP